MANVSRVANGSDYDFKSGTVTASAVTTSSTSLTPQTISSGEAVITGIANGASQYLNALSASNVTVITGAAVDTDGMLSFTTGTGKLFGAPTWKNLTVPSSANLTAFAAKTAVSIPQVTVSAVTGYTAIS